jgi:hypothetical protein
MSLLDIVSSEIIKIENERSIISYNFKRFEEAELIIDIFREITNSAVEHMLRHIQTLQGHFSGITYPQITESTSQFCVNTLVRLEGQSNRIRHLVSRPDIDSGELTDALSRITADIEAILTRIYSNYETTIIRLTRSEEKINCYEKMLQAIRTIPITNFNENLEMYYEDRGINIEISDDERSVLNHLLLSFPGVIRFIYTLSNVARRNRVIEELKNYKPEQPDAIFSISNELMELINCEEKYHIFADVDRNLKEDITRFFSDGGWLEAYTYLMVERAGCSTRLLNAVLSGVESTSLEADVLALYRGNLIMIECKDRAEFLSDSDYEAINKKLEIVRKYDIHKVVFALCCGSNFEEMERNILSIAESKTVTCNVVFLNNEGVDDLDTKLRRVLVEI